MSQPLIVTSPSQSINVGWGLLTICSYVIHPYVSLFFLLITIYKVIDVICWKYEFYDDRVVERRGIFTVNQEEVNYFRIKSIKMVKPFWMRLFDMSIVDVTSSEQFKPYIRFYGVEMGKEYVDLLTTVTKKSRKKMGIKDLDLYNF
jgi:uncharacterized membrane protein YdbT with pleckstrin-like domain